jgi:membrane associated rhomboid family serine protease
MAVCYRHPGRETAVSCSSCGKPICPDCMTATPVGMRCPECARKGTRVRTMRSVTEPVLTYALIAINVIVALAVLAGGASATGGALGGSRLLSDGWLSRSDIADGEYWRLLTSGFLHAGFFHLLFNMISLYILGSLLEPAIGRLRFGLIYFVSLLAGSFGALLVSASGPTVGASTAIFGLMGAAFIVLRHRGISPLESGLGFWILLNLLITFAVPGISIGGHLGGLIGGSLAALALFDLRERVRLPAAASTVLVVGLGVVAVIGSIAVSHSATG